MILDIEFHNDTKTFDVDFGSIVEVSDGGYERGYKAGVTEGYNNGHTDGIKEGKEIGYANGQNQYRTAMWNGIQNNGARTDYTNGFRQWKNAHSYWLPIHAMNMTAGSMVFYGFSSDLGLPELCEKAGIPPIDWSKVQTFGQTFSYATIPDIGIIDMRNATGGGSPLIYANVKKAHLILKSDGSQGLGGTFTGVNGLTDLIFEGEIGSSSFSIPSPLTPESMISVITHLKNYSGTDKDGVYKVTFTDACWAALEAHSKAPDGNTWKEHVYSLGWTC